MKKNSILTRFFTTFIANILRMGLAFMSSVFIARALGPGEYGNYIFLLGSFTAITKLVSMASSSAFFTFISRGKRGLKFYLYNAGWIVVQLCAVLAFILIMPSSLRDKIWLSAPVHLSSLLF